MPYATNQTDGVRIHYRCASDRGPVVIMQYGFMGYIDAWYEAGYVDALASDFQLVMIDPRGMEASDRPHDPAMYSMDRMAGDVLAVLDDVGASKGHFWGYSRGGRVAFALGQAHGDRIRSIIVGGMHPYRRDPETFAEQIEMFQLGWERSMPLHEAQHGPLDDHSRKLLLSNDSQALAAASIAAQRDPGFDGRLDEIGLPALIYAGDGDGQFYGQARQAAQAMPGAEFVALPGINHGQTFERSDIVAPIVREFIQRVEGGD